MPTLDLPESEFFSENREENSQLAGPWCTSGTTLENAPDAPVQCKSTRENFGKPTKKYIDQLYLLRHYSTLDQWIYNGKC